MRSAMPKVLHRVAGPHLARGRARRDRGAVRRRAPSSSSERTGSGSTRASRGATCTSSCRIRPCGTGDACPRRCEVWRRTPDRSSSSRATRPLLRPETLARLVALRRAKRRSISPFSRSGRRSPAISGASCATARPRDRIVEAENASSREKRIAEVNAGVYCFAPEALARALAKIGRNPVSGEYYLTDAVAILAARRGNGSRPSRPRTGARPGASTRGETSPPPRRSSGGAASNGRSTRA